MVSRGTPGKETNVEAADGVSSRASNRDPSTCCRLHGRGSMWIDLTRPYFLHSAGVHSVLDQPRPVDKNGTTVKRFEELKPMKSWGEEKLNSSLLISQKRKPDDWNISHISLCAQKSSRIF